MHSPVGEPLRSKISVNPNNFHILVEILNEDLAWRDYAHRLLIEYYKATPAELQIEVCHTRHTKTQILQLGLKQKHKHDIKLKLVGAAHSEMHGLLFGVDYRVTPPDDTVKIEQISTTDSQVKLSVQWSNPYKTYIIDFHIEKINDKGNLEDKIQCIPCKHVIHRVTEDLILGTTLPNQKNQRYCNKLKHNNETCMEWSGRYRTCIMQSDIDSSRWITLEVEADTTLSSTEKAYFSSYHGFLLAQKGRTEDAITHLKHALELNECCTDSPNYQLVQGRIHRMLAKAYRIRKDYQAAQTHIDNSLNHFKCAAYSNEVACAQLERSTLLQNSNKPVDREEVKTLLKIAQCNVKECEDTKRSQFMTPMVYIEMALFYTHSFDDPMSEYSETPSEEDLQNARMVLQHCEKCTANIQSKRGNAYLVRLNVALADLRFHEQKYAEAVDHMTEVERMLTESEGVDEHNLHIQQKVSLYKKKCH